MQCVEADKHVMSYVLAVCNWSPDIPNHNLRTIIHNGNIGGKNLGAFEDFELIRQVV